jgi:hypothetical protein
VSDSIAGPADTAFEETVRRRRRAAERLAQRGARGDFEPTRRARAARRKAEREQAESPDLDHNRHLKVEAAGTRNPDGPGSTDSRISI